MKLISKLIAVSLLTIASSGVAFAHEEACSDSEADTLRDCVESNVASCREASESCSPYRPVLTIDDVRELAIDNCCSKRSKVARNLCLVRERLKYSTKVNKGEQHEFFEAARDEVNDVRKNVCKNSAYTNLF